MMILRLTQPGGDVDGRYIVEIALEGLGPRRTATVRAAPVSDDADAGKLRWYLEQYLERTAEPAPRIAAGVERRIADIGRSLFSAIFENDRDATRLWGAVCDGLGDARIEISTHVKSAHALPWELMRDPRTDAVLALTAAEFVRTQSQAARVPYLPAVETGGPVRILLVICRPSGSLDVPFRSVASRLLKGLTLAGSAGVRLDVLRPPTIDALARKLRSAKDAGSPYHIVHFDGHGLYVTPEQVAELNRQPTFDPARLGATAIGGSRGYICFEDVNRPGGMDLVDGATLGNLLYETKVPVLVLNACRSGQGSAGDGADPPDGIEPAQEDQIRAHGSFAQAVVDAGVAGVVAMRYNVYVATAAQFVGELYQTLAEGETLGRAATRARKNLKDQPARIIAGPPVELQDWPVPAVYEATPLRLFPRRTFASPVFDASGWSIASDARTDETPGEPDVGFIGRDETLLALDRAFDGNRIVLLTAYAGSGKTATAAEFARWYRGTGGIDGPVLFDSFERYRPLARLLDKIGNVFGPLLDKQGVVWVALDEAHRRRLAIKILKQIPVLWIWDNVEQVAGFPSGAASLWNAQEQADLADFLRALATTEAKVLLTSRRSEHAWLGDLPTRLGVPPMPRRERLQLAEVLVRRHGRPASVVAVLEPLLSFAQGNPLTTTVVVKQALREGLTTRDAAEALTLRLRAGEAAFEDDDREGRSRSLGASLLYGFDQSFDEAERRSLALLHLFQGVVDAPTLAVSEALSKEIEGDTRPVGERVASWRRLLDRAAEIGLLTPMGSALFAIHPAVPWFLRSLFERYYPERDEPGWPSAAAAERHHAGAVIHLVRGAYDAARGRPATLAMLRREEDNILQVYRIALRRGWWEMVVDATEVLNNFYQMVHRSTELSRLLRVTCDLFLEAGTLSPVQGRQQCWLDAMSLAHGLADLEGRPEDASTIFDRIAADFRERVGHLPASGESVTGERLKGAQHYVQVLCRHIGKLVSNKDLDRLEFVAPLGEQAYEFACRYPRQAGALALHIGHFYVERGRSEQNLTLAEQWYRRSLDHTAADDAWARSMVVFELAQVRYILFQIVMFIEGPQRTKRLQDAMKAMREMLEAVPTDYPQQRMRAFHLAGNVYDDAGMLTGNKAFHRAAGEHYQTFIQIADEIGNQSEASLGCREMARLKIKLGEADEAAIYAREALSRAERSQSARASNIDLSRKLTAAIAAMNGLARSRRPPNER